MVSVTFRKKGKTVMDPQQQLIPSMLEWETKSFTAVELEHVSFQMALLCWLADKDRHWFAAAAGDPSDN